MIRHVAICLVASLAAWLPSASPAADDRDQACLDCHAEEGLEPVSERGKSLKLFVAPEALKGSVHEEMACLDCHSGADREGPAHYETGGPRPALACGGCHEQAQKEYDTTDIHGRAKKENHPKTPWCHDCHGGHRIKPLASPDSALSPFRQHDVCGSCHGTEEPNQVGTISKRRLIERYDQSVHWQHIKEGKPAATCSDCHGHHSILPSSDQDSRVTREGLLKTCGKCHPNEVDTFSKGSHGRTLLAGNLDVPTCTTCHGDHDIISLKVQSSGKRDFAATQICIWCHGNERMMGRYALDTSPVESYMKDFHGLTQRGSAGASATCADCHEAHHSLPSDHPESRMHLSNRGAACGKCHGQSSESFIMSFTHKSKSVSTPGSRINRIVTIVYIVLILGTVAGILLHNIVIWSHGFRLKLRYQKRHGEYVRLNSFERRWHWVLFLSFTTLALTGFALKFANSPLVSWIYTLGFTEAIRAWIHRAAAVVLILDLLLFFVYQVVSRHGRRWIVDMLPRPRDLSDLVRTMGYHLGWRRERPRYPLFNYGEKFEYWALLWGTFVMLLTGLVLWFPRQVPGDWPSWVIDVARTIHFLEAVLASLAIVLWHFFHTIFHPVEYPMDTAWLTGVLTGEEARHRFDDAALARQRPDLADFEQEGRMPERPEWMRDAEPSQAGSDQEEPKV